MPANDTTGTPLCSFQDNGAPDTISYSVPEPGSYNGRSYIDLGVPASFFKPSWRTATFQIPAAVFSTVAADQEQVLREIGLAMRNGFDSRATNLNTNLDKFFPGFPEELRGRMKYAGPLPGDPDPLSSYVLLSEPVISGQSPDDPSTPPQTPAQRQYTGVYLLDGGQNTISGISEDLQTLTAAEVLAALRQSRRLKIIQDLDGRYTYTFLPVPSTPTPMLALVEHYRLTTYLGNYGAGRTVKTISLLPGEKTKITINTYTRRTETLKEASSILDSLTKESAEDFQNTVQSEAADKDMATRSDEWQVEAKVQGRWAVGSASVSGGYAGSLNSAREQTAKNVNNAVQKHAAKASSKRDIRVEQTSETKTESGEETGVVREIQNINVGRTINFVFRQMNQEYASLLHLVDVGIAFSNGMPDSERIVPLWKLDSLLAEVLESANCDRIKKDLLRELRYVRDHQDTYQCFYEEFKPTIVENGVTQTIDLYNRPRPGLKSTYAIGSQTVTVPGIILSATKNVMCTDGIIVDTILGQSEALDEYSKNIRIAALQTETVANDLLAADLSIEQLRQQIVNQKKTAPAAAFLSMFPQRVT